MKNIFSFIIATCLSMLIIAASGCAYPNGMSKAEFEALPKEEQNRLKQEQMAQVRAQMAERKAANENQSQAQAQQVNELKANARFGDIVIVTFEGGNFNDKRKTPFAPFSREFVKGEEASVAFQSFDRSLGRGMYVKLDQNARSLYLDGYEFIEDEGWRQGQPAWAVGQRYHAKPKSINDTGIENLVLTIAFKRIP